MKRIFYYSLFFLNFFILLYFWWNHSGILLTQNTAGGILIAFGRLFGLLAVYFVLVQFLLIGRVVWIEKTFGLDKLSRIHHLNGEFSIFFILLHPIFLTFGYAISSKQNVIGQFLTFLTAYEDVFMAFLSAIIFIVIVFLSIYIVRKKLKYETWYFIHLLTYVAIILAWGHQLENGEDFLTNRWFVYYWYLLYVFVFGQFIVFRFLRPLYLFYKHRFFVEKIVKETADTNSVYISGKKMNEFKIKAGQFMIFRFLARKFWWQAHPFSLSKSFDGKTIRITPKNVGDFTSLIPQLAIHTPVLIDGPYGIFTKETAKKNKILFIAGGIGITPIRSLLEQAAKEGKNIVLLYSNKTREDIVFKKEISQLKEKYDFPVYYFLTQEEKNNDYLKGRIDETRLKTLVKDLDKRETFICGPKIFINSLRQILISLGVRKNQIHFELFSLQ